MLLVGPEASSQVQLERVTGDLIRIKNRLFKMLLAGPETGFQDEHEERVMGDLKRLKNRHLWLSQVSSNQDPMVILNNSFSQFAGRIVGMFIVQGQIRILLFFQICPISGPLHPHLLHVHPQGVPLRAGEGLWEEQEEEGRGELEARRLDRVSVSIFDDRWIDFETKWIWITKRQLSQSCNEVYVIHTKEIRGIQLLLSIFIFSAFEIC